MRGRVIVQVMPFIEDKVLEKLEQNIQNIQSVTSMLDNGHTPEEMLGHVLEGLDLEVTDTLPARFSCNCSKERIEKAIISIGKKEIQSHDRRRERSGSEMPFLQYGVHVFRG